MTNDIAPEVVERMKALCEAVIADTPYVRRWDGPGRIYEARALLPLLQALLPEPVDPDLVIARDLASKAVFYGQCQSNNGGRSWQEFRDGKCDAGDVVGDILAALKCRALEKEAGR